MKTPACGHCGWVDAGVHTALMPMYYGGMKITCQLTSTLEDSVKAVLALWWYPSGVLLLKHSLGN